MVKYSTQFKLNVVQRCLPGGDEGVKSIVRQHNLDHPMIQRWGVNLCTTYGYAGQENRFTYFGALRPCHPTSLDDRAERTDVLLVARRTPSSSEASVSRQAVPTTALARKSRHGQTSDHITLVKPIITQGEEVVGTGSLTDTQLQRFSRQTHALKFTGATGGAGKQPKH